MILRLIPITLFALIIPFSISAGENLLTEYLLDIIIGSDEYIGWPKSKSGDNSDPFFVAILGTSDITKRIRELNKAKLPDGRRLRVRVVHGDMLPANAHIIINTLTNKETVPKLLAKLKGTGTFTINISEVETAAMLTLKIVENDGKQKIGATLDTDLASEEGLKIKSKLKKLTEKSS